MALLSVAEALARVLADACPLPTVEISLADAHRRVLAADLPALRTQPPDAVSAMDGYAVRTADVQAVPAQLTVVGEVAAGRPFARPIGPGEAARIFTGGVVPPGADAVVIQEMTTREGASVVVTKGVELGKNIRTKGLDFRAGDTLLTAGRRLSSRDLMLAAAMNYPKLPVHRRPRVANFATGDELVPPGSTPGPGQIVYSNGFGLVALARDEGAEVVDLGIVPDRLDDTVAAVRRARDADVDVLVTTGGVSVGEYDLVQKAVAAEGMALSFWKVAQRPGRPLMHGRLGRMHVLGLPGNPVSAFVCGLLYLVPLLRRLQGISDLGYSRESAVLGCDLRPNDERMDFMRARLSRSDAGEMTATPFDLQDSSLMGFLADANCLVIREPYAPAAKAGDGCVIVKLPL